MHGILFFDQHCGVCQLLIQKTARRDSRTLFSYAPLGGETAQQLHIEETHQVVLRVDHCGGNFTLYHASAAILFLMQHQDGRLLRTAGKILQFLPVSLLDFSYYGFARIRQHLPIATPKSPHSILRGRLLP